MERTTWKTSLRWLGALAAPACLVLICHVTRAQRSDSPENWSVPRLVNHLTERGLSLHLVSTGLNDDPRYGAFLTTQPRTSAELASLCKHRQRIACWEGVVSCDCPEHLPYCDFEIRSGGDCYLVAGRFIFFGDRLLLGRIRCALGIPEPETDPSGIFLEALAR